MRHRWMRLACWVLLLTWAQVSGAAADAIARVAVDGTAFRVTLQSGRELVGRDLVGAKLSIRMADSQPVQQVRVAAIVADPDHPAGEVLLHRLLLVDPRTGAEAELCDADAKGERWAFPLRGQWDREGQRVSDTGFTLTCAADAQGKCVRFGYMPWKTLADGTALAPYHQACVRLVRADYCGGHGTTRDGMLIDVYDRLGINHPADAAATPELRFEAAWNESGAVCVAHTRVPANMTLEQLATSCPRLRGRLGEANCRPDTTVDGGGGTALLLNRSK